MLQTARELEGFLLPISDATNGYDLFTDVMTAIEQEPKRLDMGTWFEHRTTNEWPVAHVPACRTAACFAGWAATLKAVKYEPIVSTLSEQAIDLLIGPDPTIYEYDEVREDQVPVITPERERWRAAKRELVNLFYTTTPTHQMLSDIGIAPPTDDASWPECERYDAMRQFGSPEYTRAFLHRMHLVQEQIADALRAHTID